MSLALVAALGLASIGIAPAASAQASTCSGDTCDGGKWQLARGVANEVSYWGMSPGHNCTNYVAWRLIENGVDQPPTNPGDAATWAERAILDGYVVDKTPQVGAVAHWGSLAGGHGVYGHVAYVEQVNTDGTILISEDFWGEEQLGPLTFSAVLASEVSNFIHYDDQADWLRTAAFGGGLWGASSTGLDPTPKWLAAMTLDGTTPLVFFSEEGSLIQASPGANGWDEVDTGVPFDATSMGAVDMGRGWPFLMSVDTGVLIMTVKTESGWRRMSTGIEVTGEVAAVNLGGLWPTTFVSQGGSLYRVWGDMDGWKVEKIGIEMEGPIAAAVSSTGYPEIYSVENGMLSQTWQDELGWYKQRTEIPASGKTTAVATEGGVHVMLVQDDAVFRISRSDATWTKEATGLDGGEFISAVNLGGATPAVIQVG